MRCEFDTCRRPLPGAEIESLRATSLILSGATGRAARSESHCSTLAPDAYLFTVIDRAITAELSKLLKRS
jgi:hypothetical protein